MRAARPSVVLAAVIVVLVLALSGATRWGPDRAASVDDGAPGGAGAVVPVSSTTLGCPDASAAGGPESGTDVTLVAPPVVAASTSPDATPDATSGVTPGATPGATPGVTPGATPGVTPGATPGATPGVTPAATPDATPGATPGATPAATPAATAAATPGATPDATPAATPGSGVATAASLEAGAAPLITLDAQGPAASAAMTATDLGPVAVRTVGALAPGLSATQLSTVGVGEATGLAATTCTAPATDRWFAGFGTEIGHQPVLTVVNLDEVAAEVAVNLYGTEGPVEVASLRDVVIPVNGSVAFALDTLAPDLTEVAAHVQALSGRVVAGVRDSRVEGLNSLGVEWVPASTEPSTRVLVPGLRGGGGARLLHLLAPGELDTLVQVRLLTTTGAIVPADLGQIELTAGAVSSIDLAAAVGADVVAVELTADEPIVAGLRSVTDGTGDREMSYTAGSEALTGPAILADVRSGGGWTSSLTLTADDGGAPAEPPIEPPGEPTATPSGAPSGQPTPGTEPAVAVAEVDLQLVDAATGEVIATSHETIPAGSTVDVPLVAGADDSQLTRFSVVVTPTAGVVHGALQLTLTGGTSAGVTVLPLFSPTLVVDIPFVRQDLGTGLRPRG